MATVTLTALAICGGGDHVRLRLDVNGVERLTKTFKVPELVDTLDDTDTLDIVRTLVRLHKIGKTNAQVKTDLLAGLTITV